MAWLRSIGMGILAALGVALALVSVADGSRQGSAPEPPAERPRPVHADAKELEAAVLDATRAFLREDAAAARLALDRIEAGCRRLMPEEEEIAGSAVVSFDRAFHLTLNRSRELATRGNLDGAFDQFVWIQRSCRKCHALRREWERQSAGEPKP